MPFTYDITTDIGKVRAVIGDTDSANPFLDDVDITAMLGIESGDIKLTAALALESMASKFNAILKKIENLDLKTDAPSMAREFRELAKQIRNNVNATAANGVLEVANQLYTTPAYDEDTWARIYRGELL